MGLLTQPDTVKRSLLLLVPGGNTATARFIFLFLFAILLSSSVLFSFTLRLLRFSQFNCMAVLYLKATLHVESTRAGRPRLSFSSLLSLLDPVLVQPATRPRHRCIRAGAGGKERHYLWQGMTRHVGHSQASRTVGA